MMNPKTPPQICEWIGDGERCGASAAAGRSYCEHHLFKIYQEGSARRRRKDQRRADRVRDLESLLNDAIQELVDEGMDL